MALLHGAGGVFLIIKSYFDASGDASTKFIGLAVIAASAGAWDAFESSWRKALARHGLSYSHMADNHGAALIKDLLPVFYDLLKDKQTCACMTMVPVRDHERAQKIFHTPSIHCLFVYWCLNELLQFYSSSVRFEFVFDQGERFFHEINKHWTVQSTDSRLRRIDTLGKRDMRKTIPLQSADIFAWEMNRLWSNTYLPPPTTLTEFMKKAPCSLPKQDNPEATNLLLSTKTKRWEMTDFQ